MKPRASWFEDPEYRWNEREGGPPAMAHSMSNAEPERGTVAGRLIIPDVETKTGWREWWVYKDVPQAQRRKAGF